MMNKEELAPHVREISRALDGKVADEVIEKELDGYLNLYRMTLDTSKKHVVRKYGGDPGALTAGTRKLVGQLGMAEQSVDLLVKIVSSSPREVTVDGAPKMILSGVMGDESGTVQFTVWDVGRFDLKQGSTYLIRSAYTKEFGGQPKVNLGSRASVEQRQDGEVSLPDGVATSSGSPTSYSAPVTATVSGLRENMNNVTLTGRLLTLTQREVDSASGKKTVFSGHIADSTGKVEFSAWHDFGLQEGEVIKVSNAYVKGWRGIPRLTFGERASVERPDAPFPSTEELSGTFRRTIEDLERAGGAADVTVSGTIVEVKKGSGLIMRCSECSRVMQKGVCSVHGKVKQNADLRVKAVLDDGSAAMTVVMKKDVTEQLIGVSLDEALEEARNSMDTDILMPRIEEKLLVRSMDVTGNVTSDEYGLMMIVSAAAPASVDVKAEAEKLMSRAEGSA